MFQITPLSDSARFYEVQDTGKKRRWVAKNYGTRYWFVTDEHQRLAHGDVTKKIIVAIEEFER